MKPRGARARLLGPAIALIALAALPGTAVADPPVNDAYPGTDLGSVVPVNVLGTNDDATTEGNEPDVVGVSFSASVWWTWTAPADGVALISTCGSDFDTVLGVYTDSDGTLPVDGLVAENDDAVPVFCGESADESAVAFKTTAGQAYRILVDGWNSGDIVLSISHWPGPSNDDWANRTPIGPELPVSVVATNVGATVEPGEPPLPLDGINGEFGRTVWFSFTPEGSGEVTVSTCGASLDTSVGVFTGTDVASLTQVGGGDDGCPVGRGSLFTFETEACTEYSLGVGGWGEDAPDFFEQGTFTLRLEGDLTPAASPCPKPPGPGTDPGGSSAGCDDAKAALKKAKKKLKKAKKKLRKAKTSDNARKVKKAKKKVKKAKKKVKKAKAKKKEACAKAG